MSIQRRKINGPLQAAHGRLARNTELVRYLRACEYTFRQTTAALLLQACVEEYAPELLAPKTGTYNRISYREQIDKITEDVMWRMRAMRTQGQGNVSELIEKAIVRWLDRNVVEIRFDDTLKIWWALTHEEHARRVAEQETATAAYMARIDAMIDDGTKSTLSNPFLTEPAEDATMTEHTP